MISVYDVGNEAFTANGDAVLHPISCVATENAGGSYEIALVEPIRAGGGWTHLVNDAIVKAPVPVPVIENAYVGQDVDVYKINSNGTALREEPNEPTRITYQTWQDRPEGYNVGSKVTYSVDGHNYQLMRGEGGTSVSHNPPTNSEWSRIADYTTGAPVLTTLAADTEVYYVEASGTSWAEVSTKQGITGYVKNSQITFVRHETVEPVPPREVEDQLFRIYKVVISNDQKECTVNARHVSYDLAGVLITDCNISLAEPAMTIMRIRDAMMVSYRGEIATNMTGTDNGTYTGNLSGKNGISAFLDPDKGVIPYFRGKLIRDNWDLFLMKNDLVDRGFRITYGANMRGVTWTRDSDQRINRVVPVAKDASGNDLYLASVWVDSPNGVTPVVKMERLRVDGQVGKDDGTGTDTNWTEQTLLEHMEEKAEERFSVDHVDAVKVELQVDFTMLGDTEEYKQFKDLQDVYMYDLVRVADPNVGLNLQLQVSQTRFDCILERFIGINVGNVFDYGGRTVWGYNIGNGAIDYEKISLETIRRIQAG